MRVESGKGQSAIEFLTVYGYVFLIIGIMIGLIALYFSIPRTIVPFQCNFYSGFQCTDAAFATNTTSGVTSLIIVASDTQPGIVNISAFNAVVNGQQQAAASTSFCMPQQVMQGQYVYCMVNFSFTTSQSAVYTGNFSMRANYCGSSAVNVSTANCVAGSNYVYSGSVRIQPTLLYTPLNSIINSSPHTSFYVPITLTDTQTAAEPAPFQQFLEVDAASYAKYERSDLGNIRFFYNNRELQSWCEANCASSAANALFWVRLPFGFSKTISPVVDMYFLSNTVDYDCVYAGENPMIPSDYQSCDNGANVFLDYGTGVSASGWTIYGTAGVTTAAPAGSPFGANSYYSDSGSRMNTSMPNMQGNNFIVDYYGYTQSLEDVFFDANSTGYGQLLRVGNGAGWFGTTDTTSWSNWDCPTGSDTFSNEWGLVEEAVNSIGYPTLTVWSGPPPLLGLAYLSPSTTENGFSSACGGRQMTTVQHFGNYVGLMGDGGGGVQYFQLFIVRAYPANDIMPTATFGNVVRVT